MKKVLIIALVLVLGLSLFACASEPTVEAGKEAEKEIANMINPWQYSEDQKIFEGCSIQFNKIPEGATDITFGLLADEELIEMQYTLNGTRFCARMKSTDKFEDISGMNYTWEKEEDFTADNCSGKKYHATDEGKNVDLALWYDVVPGVMYSLSAVGTESIDIVASVNAFFEPIQGNRG